MEVILLLDTHVLLWWLSDSRRLSRAQLSALKKVSADSPAHVCDISLWEIATLAELGRMFVRRTDEHTRRMKQLGLNA